MAAGMQGLPAVSLELILKGGATEAPLCRGAAVIRSREVAEQLRGSPDCPSPIIISRLGLASLFFSAFILFSMFWG